MKYAVTALNVPKEIWEKFDKALSKACVKASLEKCSYFTVRLILWKSDYPVSTDIDPSKDFGLLVII